MALPPGRRRHGYDAAFDVGTAYVRAFGRGRTAFTEEPSVVGVRGQPAAFLGAGVAAEQACTAGGGQAVWPVRSGVVVDVDAAGWLLSTVLRRVRRLSLARPALLACAPSDASPAEVEMLVSALRRAGAGAVDVVPEPLAAAVGSGLDIGSPYAQMLVDVGDGVVDTAIIRAGRIEVTAAVRLGCADVRRALVAEVARRSGVVLHWREARRLIEAPAEKDGERGPDLVGRGRRADGGEATVAVPRGVVARAVGPLLESVVAAARRAWSAVSPETSCELIESGISVTGGGARVPGLLGRLAAGTGLDVHASSRPEHAVIRGAGRMAWG